nr:glycine-rich cell wall structural protein 1-like [Rhipicephalus microplus]
MAKIISLSLLAFCALLLPTYGQEAQPQLADLKTGGAGGGSAGSGSTWLPRPGLGRGCRRRREIVKRCVSSSCGEYKCSDLHRFSQRVCTADCRTGCFCAWPFFRNNDGRCVHFWQCYTYRRPRRPALSGSIGGAVGPQPGVDQGDGVLGAGWPTTPGFVPGGAWGGPSGVPNSGWGSAYGQYPGAWGGASYPQYPGSWSSPVGNGVFGAGNGGFAVGNGGLGSGSGGLGVVSGGVAGGNGGYGIGSGSFGVGGGSSGVSASGAGISGSTSGGLGSITGSGAFGNVNAGATNVKVQG